MPAFIKTKKDEEIWAKAKKAVDKSKYPEDVYWKIVTTVFKKMKAGKNKKDTEKSIKYVIKEALSKSQEREISREMYYVILAKKYEVK